MEEPEIRDALQEVIRGAIYHGRHFAPKRDDIVIKKSVERLIDIYIKIYEEMR